MSEASRWWKTWNEASPVTRGGPLDGQRAAIGAKLTITEQHAALLRATYTAWHACEFGAMEVDPKRPYGNSNGTYDVARVLGLEIGTLEDDPFLTDEQEALCLRLHRETEFCIQILLQHLALEVGATYRNDAEPYRRASWTKLEKSA